MAAVGTDKVLIGAPWDGTGAFAAGSAYLFSTSGALLTHFPNPAPASEDGFGYEVAAVGNDRVLIAAYHDDAGARDAGSAYLFTTDGAGFGYLPRVDIVCHPVASNFRDRGATDFIIGPALAGRAPLVSWARRPAKSCCLPTPRRFPGTTNRRL